MPSLELRAGRRRRQNDHLVRSHAHEEHIPGTVSLSAKEGDDTAYGQALFPVPAQDPNDPLQWPNGKKTTILVIVCLYSFLANSSLTGISVYIQLYAKIFSISPASASNLISYPNLAFGFCSLIWVPLYLKFGRRPVMLASMSFYLAGLIATSQVNTFNGLMSARCVMAFGSGVCEALPLQLINDIFFIHERGKRVGYYTVCLSISSVAPVAAGYMLNAGYSWRLFFYVCSAFSAVVFIASIFAVEETSYDRTAAFAAETLATSIESDAPADASITAAKIANESGHTFEVPLRKSFWEILSVRGRVDRDVSPAWTALRSFTYLLVPQALWVITTFGIYIGLAAFGIGFTFPIIITAPPYNWHQSSAGLQAVASAVGFLLAVPFSSASDRLAAYLTRRNKGIREAEMRLGVLLVPLLVGPAGLVLYAIAAARKLSWPLYFVAGGMMSWSGYFYFAISIAYAVDAHFANTSEMLIAINVGKQAVSFAFGNRVLIWLQKSGYAVLFGAIFSSLLLVNNLFVIVFIIWGKSIRTAMADSWLAQLHHRTMS